MTKSNILCINKLQLTVNVVDEVPLLQFKVSACNGFYILFYLAAHYPWAACIIFTDFYTVSVTATFSTVTLHDISDIVSMTHGQTGPHVILTQRSSPGLFVHDCREPMLVLFWLYL